jgi:hypothetical protein
VSLSNGRTGIVAGYLVLACIAWGLGYFIHPAILAPRLVGMVAVIYVLLGPSAWLIYGIEGIPVFLVATFLIMVAATLALLFVGRFSHPMALWLGMAFTACVWLATGWFAWTLAFIAT